MYLDYFSLEKFPFRITPDPSLFFPGGSDGRGVVLDALIYAINAGEGILKVVGEVGSGKTMLCRMLGSKLSDTVEIVYLANPNLSARDIIFAITFELELDVEPSTEPLQAMHKLQEYLLKKHSEGGTVVVFIEEAQSMPLEALEEIRLLSNLETHQHKLMQIVLFGQPELDRKLEKKSIRQLRERITHSFNLEPLSVEVTQHYLRFRLQAAGCPWPQLFTPRAEKKLARAATGLTRRINILADKALLAAYADPLTQKDPRSGAGEIQSMVLPRHVNAAIRDCGYRKSPISWLGYTGAGIVSIVVLGLLINYSGKLGYFSTEQESIATALTTVEPGNAPVVQVFEAESNAAALLEESVELIDNTIAAPAIEVKTNNADFISLREAATEVWLDKLSNLSEKVNYTLQLGSVINGNRSSLEEFLAILSAQEMINDVYVCTVAATDQSPEQWLVLHGEFEGITQGSIYLDGLSESLKRFTPFIKSIADLACEGFLADKKMPLSSG